MSDQPTSPSQARTSTEVHHGHNSFETIDLEAQPTNRRRGLPTYHEVELQDFQRCCKEKTEKMRERKLLKIGKWRAVAVIVAALCAVSIVGCSVGLGVVLLEKARDDAQARRDD